MKNLTDYPTPETNEIFDGYIEMTDSGQFRYNAIDFGVKSRDLERRLAACRDTLQSLIESDGDCGARNYAAIHETLVLTAPKP